MRVVNTTKGTILAERAEVAGSFWQRLKGLLGRPGLSPQQGLVILSCNSVHTAFMRFSIDVVFLSREGKVIRTVPSMGPFRITPIYWAADKVVELPPGTIQGTRTEIADTILIE